MRQKSYSFSSKKDKNIRFKDQNTEIKDNKNPYFLNFSEKKIREEVEELK